MRIGMLTQWFPPEPGPAALPGDLARELVARGHEVEVVTGFPNYPAGEIAPGYRMRARLVEDLDGVRVTRVPLYPSHDASSVRRLANYGSFATSAAALGVPTAFRGLDALWVNYSPVTVALPMLLTRALRHTPALVHVLDLWPDTLSATGFGGAGLVSRSALRGAEAACNAMYRSAARVAYISPGVGAVLAERGVPADKLAYAPMWADESLYRPRAAPAPRPHGLADDRIALVYAGTLGRAQGLEPLIRACAEVRDLPLTCLVAGSGVDEERLRGLARDLDTSNVEFLGRLPASDMPDLMAAGDLNYISLNDDPLAAVTMPSKVQAVMASGKAILASLTGDAAGVVHEADAGWVTRPGDVAGLVASLRSVVAAGREELAHRGARARAYYEREFSRSRGTDRIEALLEGIAGQRR